MRILYAANANWKYHGLNYYNVDHKLYAGLVRAGHAVYWLSDRDVSRMFSPLRIRKIGKTAVNEALITTCKRFAPEMLVIGQSGLITDETLAAVRDAFPAIRIAQFNVDPVFNPANAALIRRQSVYCHANFVTVGGPILSALCAPGGVGYFMPNPVDPAIETHRNFERKDLPYDIFTAMHGSARNPDAERDRLPDALARAIPSLRTSYHGFGGHGRIEGHAYMEALGAARCGLNISRSTWGTIEADPKEIWQYSSDRIAQYMGNGLAVLVPARFKLDTVYGKDALVTFDGEDELIEAVLALLKDDGLRQRVAKAGWDISHSAFTGLHVAKFMVEATMGGPISRYSWNTEAYRAAA